jgi:hypothetical protein
MTSPSKELRDLSGPLHYEYQVELLYLFENRRLRMVTSFFDGEWGWWTCTYEAPSDRR